MFRCSTLNPYSDLFLKKFLFKIPNSQIRMMQPYVISYLLFQIFQFSYACLKGDLRISEAPGWRCVHLPGRDIIPSLTSQVAFTEVCFSRHFLKGKGRKGCFIFWGVNKKETINYSQKTLVKGNFVLYRTFNTCYNWSLHTCDIIRC